MARKRWTLVAVCAATFMLLLDITVVNVALPSIREDLGSSFEDLQWVVDAYALTLAAFVLTAGSLADRLGRRRVFLFGLAVFTAASAACALAASPLMLNVARAVQGIGGAVMFAVSLALLAQEFRGEERGRATAIYGATIGAAVAAGPLVGGALTEGLGWEWIFWINVPLGLAAMALTVTQVGESRDPAPRGIDWFGLVSFSIANGLLVFALLRGNDAGWGSTLVVGCLSGAAALLVAFVLAQARVRDPMLPLDHFRNRSFTAAQIGAFAISGSMFALFLYITLYVQNIIGHDALEAGLIYLPSTVVTLLASGATAAAMGRVPLRFVLGAGLALTGIGLLAMSGRSEGDEWIALLPGFLISGVGVGLTNPVLANIALSTVPDEQSGVASGINDTFRQVGVATGVAALGALLLARAADHVERALGIGHEQAQLLAEGVSSGALGPDVPAAVAAAARQGFLDGLNLVLVMGAVLAFAGALLTVWLVRESDLIVHPDESPTTGRPPVTERAEEIVGFVLGRREPRDGGRAQLVPIGTAFFVSIPGRTIDDGLFTYVVTARHVVEPERETFVRVKRDDGSSVRLRIARWVFSETADVAVAHLAAPPWTGRAGVFLERPANDRHDGPSGVTPGQQVLFKGLLADIRELAGRNVPMTRVGTIGALYQDTVPIARRGGPAMHVTAHLIDCPSFAGISGSPCFVRLGERTLLLGLMSGHFDKWTKLKGSGDFKADYVGTVETPVNSGVAVCTPVEALRETLYQAELVRARAQQESPPAQ